MRLLVILLSVFTLTACTAKISFKNKSAGNDKLANPPSQNPQPSPTPCSSAKPDGGQCPEQPTPTPKPTVTPQPQVTESFDQTSDSSGVDILVVADDSYSMAPQQDEMGKKFKSFADALKGVNYQLGIITTDVYSNSREGSKGRLAKLKGPNASGVILQSSNPDAAAIFHATVKRGINGSTSEQPLAAMIMAVDKRNAENKGFFREGAGLAVLVLSDEDEKSSGKGTKASEVVEAVKATFGDKKFAVHGIVIVPGDVACYKSQSSDGNGDSSTSVSNAYYATRVADLSKLTGGSLHSICASDFSAPLKSIGQSVNQLASTFTLSRDPVPGTVTVKLSTGEAASYKVEGRKVIFLKRPALGTKIEITYTPAN